MQPPTKKLRTEPSWLFQDGKTWGKYAEEDVQMLEGQFKGNKGAGAVETTAFSFNKGYNTKYTVNFDNMQQTNQSSKTVRNIRRLPALEEISWEFKDDAGLFVEFYEADADEIECMYRSKGLNQTVQTKNLTWNKGYDSLYTYTFTKEVVSGGVLSEVWGTQKNEDSGRVRELRRTPKKAAWATEGFGISGNTDELKKLQQQLGMTTTTAAAPAAPPAAAATPAPVTNGAPATPPASPAPAPAAPAPAAGGGVGKSTLIRAPTLALPPHWEKAKTFDAVGGHHQIPVSADSAEYKEIAQLVLSTLQKSNVSVKSVTRLENAALYTFYAMTRMVVANGESTLSGGGGGKGSAEAANEKFLFTGERNPNNMVTLLKFGFDTRVAPKDGAFGQGLYFGTEASWADNGRCYQGADGSKEIIVCRVTLGRSAKGEKNIRRPPPLDPKKPTMALYDSCHDDNTPPKTYILFNNKQVYPEYIVKYM